MGAPSRRQLEYNLSYCSAGLLRILSSLVSLDTLVERHKSISGFLPGCNTCFNQNKLFHYFILFILPS